MSEKMKIVINLNEKAATVGIQKPDCDPFFFKVEGGLPAVLKAIPNLVEQAIKGWEVSKRYPKCETQLTPPATQVSPARQEKPKPQPAMF